MRVSSAAVILVPVMLALCSRPSSETVYLLNCRLINSGPPIYRQGCKAETRDVEHMNVLSAKSASRGKKTQRQDEE
jgi:hypothetical protein